MRALADDGRAVVAITHSTSSLELASKLVVMGRGGHLCFCGPPAAALDFFGADRFDEIYQRLDQRPAEHWRATFESSEFAPPRPSEHNRAEPVPHSQSTGRSSLRQALVLTRRYLRTFLRDRVNLAILFAPVPALALLIAVIFSADPFRGNGHNAATFLFLLITTAIWFGALGASREVVKERSIHARERAVGVANVAYLVSKTVLLFTVVALQVAMIAAITFAVHPLHQSPRSYVAVVGVLVLSGFAGAAFGLLISALVKREEQAVSTLPYLLIPQLALAGALVPVHGLPAALAKATSVVFARWSFEAIGGAAHVGRLPALGHESVYGGFFTGSTVVAVGALALFLVLLQAVTLRLLNRS